MKNLQKISIALLVILALLTGNSFQAIIQTENAPATTNGEQSK